MNAISCFSEDTRAIQDSSATDFNYFLTEYFNYDKDTQIIITDTKDNIIAPTKNALSVHFVNAERDIASGIGIIDYDKFRKSMTDEQYKKITEYLTQKKTEDGKYYVLSCLQYYASGVKITYEKIDDGDESVDIVYRTQTYDEIIPKAVGILLTEDSHSWFVQDELIESFELNPVVESKSILESTGEMNRNIIETDFVLGKYEREDIIGEITSQLQENNSDTYAYNVNVSETSVFSADTDLYKNLYNTSPFTYVFYQEKLITYTVPKLVESNGEVTIYSNQEYSTGTYTIKYAHKFNVLESCMDRLIFMFIYIFAVFLIVGIIIGAVTWRTLKKQIIQENQLRTITNSMAHELKTPLFVIGGYAENLIENINTEKQTHYANVILEKSESMNRLVAKMLDYSKLDWSGMKLHTEQFNFTEMVEKVIENYFMEAIDLECDKDILINADKRLIKSAIENLIDNAVKYTTAHGEIKVTISEGLFTVSNPFNSVTKSEIDDMWQPYHRQAEQSSKPGHGLGLAIVKSIFNLHKFKYGATYANDNIVFWFRF